MYCNRRTALTIRSDTGQHTGDVAASAAYDGGGDDDDRDDDGGGQNDGQDDLYYIFVLNDHCSNLNNDENCLLLCHTISTMIMEMIKCVSEKHLFQKTRPSKIRANFRLPDGDNKKRNPPSISLEGQFERIQKDFRF